MEKFSQLTGVAAPMKITNVDTDMIIPKQYLKTIARTGLGKGLFAEMRYREDGSENPDFVLNKPAYRKAQIIVAEDNFGCGSSREHAPWALQDYGFRAIVAPSFADIFYANCTKIGLLPVALPEDTVKAIMAEGEAAIDLEAQDVEFAGRNVPFEIDPDVKYRLLNGLDDIALTLEEDDAIARYESERERPGPVTTAI